MTEVKIDRELARRVLEVVDQGLVRGVGNPIPGQMCVEAAVCFAMGLPHGDNPSCVAPVIRSLKICLNDANWPDNISRAKGMRELAILQLGTKDNFDNKEFVKRVAIATTKELLPYLSEIIDKFKIEAEECSKVNNLQEAKQAALKYKSAAYAADAASAHAAAHAAAYASDAATDAAYVAAYAAHASAHAAAHAAYAAYAASAHATAKSKKFSSLSILTFFAKLVCKILIDMNVPGVAWLDLLE